MTAAGGRTSPRKELDEVKGIPAYPSTAEFAGWKRETRYAAAAASTQPKQMLHHMLQAERWSGGILSMPVDLDFETYEDF